MTPPAEVAVRRLGPGDGALLRRIASNFKAREVTGAYAERFVARPEHIVLAALFRDAVIGFALAYELERVDRERPMIFFYELGVDAPHRRRGVGRALVERLKAEARERNAVKLYVLADEENEAARALYRAAGGEASPQVLFNYAFEDA